MVGEQTVNGLRTRTILYIQHAGTLGGSCTSLRYMVEALDRRRFRPIVALTKPTPQLVDYHAAAGLEVIEWPGIETFDHTTAGWSSLWRPLSWEPLAKGLAGWRETERRTLELVERVRPDLVHLNSAVLVASARALHRRRVPFVWHVREYPERGHIGLRHRYHCRALATWPSTAIFLSEVGCRAWGNSGVIVPEFIDFSRFTPDVDPLEARRRLGIPEGAKTVLYVGGLQAIKGYGTLVHALSRLRSRIQTLVCLMPGCLPQGPVTTLVGRAGQFAFHALGIRTPIERIESLGEDLGVAELCRRMPFSDDVPSLIAASDLLVFPSTVDHFARPVVEAAAMERPVVASRFPMLEDVVLHGETGLLVPPANPDALAVAIAQLLADPQLARAMGVAGRARVLERFDVARNTEAMMRVYDEAIAGPS